MSVANYFTDGDFTTPVRVNRARVSRPFSAEGDNSTRVIEVDYVQHQDYFYPDTPDRAMHLTDYNWNDFPVAYLVNESALEPLGSDLVQFTRTFAEIPKTRVIGESYAWRRPGISGGTLSSTIAISASASSTGQTLLTLSTVSGLSVGDLVLVRYYVGWTDSGSTVYRYAQRNINDIVSSVIYVDLISDPMGTPRYEWALKYSQYRDAETMEVGSFVTLDYFLPGVSSNVSSFRNIPIIPRDIIRDSSGKETDLLANDSDPTQTAYLTDVKNQVLRVVVASTVRRWMGNIFERSTRYVVTQ